LRSQTNASDFLHQKWDVTYYFPTDGRGEVRVVDWNSNSTEVVLSDPTVSYQVLHAFDWDSDGRDEAIVEAKGATGLHVEVWGTDALTTASSSPLRTPELRLFPNPTSGELRLDFSSDTAGTARLVLYDVGGRRVFERSGIAVVAGSNVVSLRTPDKGHTGLASGTYFAVLHLPRTQIRNKVTILR